MDPTTPLLQPFVEQSVSIRSIVAFGFRQPVQIAGNGELPAIGGKDAAFLRPVAGEGAGHQVTGWETIRLPADDPVAQRAPALGSLATEARTLAGDAPGDDLLLLPAELLLETMTPVADDFAFRAVAVLGPPTRGDSDDWKLHRSLFDRGLVCIATVSYAGFTARCFLASEAIRSLRRFAGPSRGEITVSTLCQKGRFANQLFEYSYAKLYALRHGLTAAFPAWDGQRLYGLDDPSCAGITFPRLSFAPFADGDRQMWDREDPPINVDLHGSFQETPACWQRHRPLLRCLFRLPAAHLQAIDTWRRRVTEDGQRTLVAIHVRRGDYRKLQLRAPWFRLVPEEWYLQWLRALWPTLSRPLLFVATDEPQAIRPAFREFETASATFGPPADLLPEAVREFEILRCADHLAICNSSFSRMAAILAPSTQKCYVPSFETQTFSPYEPWIDPAFWARFRGP